MQRTISCLALLVLTLIALTGCGNGEQGSVSAPTATSTVTIAAGEVQSTLPPSAVISEATATTEPSPTSVAVQPPATAAIEPSQEAKKASVIFFSAPN